MKTSVPRRLTDTGFTDPLVIETRDLHKRYGSRTALGSVSLQVPAGAVYLLVGPNGAGKSTIMKTLMGLVRQDSGNATVLGLDAVREGPTVRANIGYLSDDTAWGYGWMNIKTLFEYHARYYSRWDAAYMRQLTDFFQFRPDARLASLSKGEQRRVQIATALAHRPPVLLLDEPTDGLDPAMRDETFAMLVDHLSETPTTVLLSTHHVEEAERLADYVGVISNGNLCAQVSYETLQRELLQYRFQTPDRWQGAPALDDRIVRKTESPREQAWTIWGRQAEVVSALTATGVSVSNVTPLSLLDATICLLKSDR